jgi:transcription elongation factor Elf1
MFSRNIPKRYAEDQKFLSVTGGVRKFFRIRKKRFEDRGEYRHFTCPKCGQDVRVPKGKGHVRITCPKCRTSFEKNV